MAGGGTAIMCDVARPCCTSSCPRPKSSASPKRCCSVFARFGDYQHKQRNRMKFMIRTLGWDALARGIRARARRVPPARRRADARHRPAGSRGAARLGARERRRRPGTIASRVAAATVDGPGHHAGDRAGVPRRATRRTRGGARRTSGRRSSSASRWRRRRVPLGDLTSEQMRVLGELARRVRRRHACASRRIRTWCSAGSTRRDVRRALSAARGRGPRARGGRDDRRRRRAARAPSRAASRSRSRAASAGCSRSSCARGRISSRRPTARASRSAAARTAAVSITSRRSGSRGACAASAAARCRSTSSWSAAAWRWRRGVRAARGQDSGAPDSRSRRAADRALCARARSRARSAPAFFGRVDLRVVKQCAARPGAVHGRRCRSRRTSSISPKKRRSRRRCMEGECSA